ncbi:MAG: hypothetical protein F6K54_01860 [Okeania sp. SIO3B5]|uniref:hypothetical protein n=1 Tax=Okeania sp. SIO3B5 TaxID=2607811 RepID=UPI0013FFDE38|nr:hypothetical protein [Okeania sp. SIO3B5]NEO51943.1 hypothetical protein [Okeania sp. SIO3B5]
MRVNIRFEDEVSKVTSNKLIELADLIKKECGVSVIQEEQELQQGVKGKRTTAIAIASLVFTTFQTVIGAAQYWKSENPKYIFHIYSNTDVLLCTLDNTSREETDRVTSIIGSCPPDVIENIEIRILAK